MTQKEILSKLTEIFRDVFDDRRLVITRDTTAEDIFDWDSLNHMTLISEVESEFGVKFKAKDVIGMQNVGEMIDRISEMLQ